MLLKCFLLAPKLYNHETKYKKNAFHILLEDIGMEDIRPSSNLLQARWWHIVQNICLISFLWNNTSPRGPGISTDTWWELYKNMTPYHNSIFTSGRFLCVLATCSRQRLASFWDIFDIISKFIFKFLFILLL